MYVSGTKFVHDLSDGAVSSIKMVFNAKGAIFFPASEQHRDQKADGISYEDDYAGNALAALLTNQQIEVRYHRDFADAQVMSLIQLLTGHPGLLSIREWRLTYQGRELPARD